MSILDFRISIYQKFVREIEYKGVGVKIILLLNETIAHGGFREIVAEIYNMPVKSNPSDEDDNIRLQDDYRRTRRL